MNGVALTGLVCLAAAGALVFLYLLRKVKLKRPKPERKPKSWVKIYCPLCAHRLVKGKIGGKEKRLCPKCAWVDWDNPKPKAKTLIPTTDGKIVLIRGISGGLELPGGYVEPFESLEDGAKRETFEETGLVVEIVRELAVIMPPRRNEHEHFFLTKPVCEKPYPGDDATEALTVPIQNVPYDEIKVSWHRDVIKSWINSRGRC